MTKIKKTVFGVALALAMIISNAGYAQITTTVTDIKDLKNGLALEIGTFTCTSQVGVLTLSAGSTTHSAGDVAITYPYMWNVAADGTSVAVPEVGLDVTSPNTLRFTCAATSNTGDYRVLGEKR